MLLQALYTGKQKVDLKERKDAKTGDVLPAFKGTNYTFLVNDWDKDGNSEELFGHTYIDRREVGEEIKAIEEGTIQLGEKVYVNIQKRDLNVRFYCRLDLEKEQDETPF